ncbi:MAG TPA: DUF6311 domain-containing protein [Thermoanaerobaculia bacterium]|nr:DUF6311 domain-containing protein [Thermoanaerobaculia bacterium]
MRQGIVGSSPSAPDHWRRAATSLLLGVMVFLAVGGGGAICPTSVEWLLEGDPAQHFLGWQFFRDAPLQLPLGANPAFGMEMGSSIVFTDSLPLFAFPFKVMEPLLPPLFQYTGLWLLACFVLQAWFAQALLARFTGDWRLLAVGAAFFVVAPPLLWRLHGHYPLLGHWLLLAALALYFRPRFSPGGWMTLLAAASLVHAYLLVMSAAVLLADLGQRRLADQLGWRRLALGLALCLGSTAAVMWLAGYFMVPSGSAGGFGFYRMNLLSPIDPDAEWSRLLPDLPQAGGDYEGFNFLGFGMLLLAGLALAMLRPRALRRVDWRRALPLLLLAAGLTAIALSHRVGLGTREVLTLPLPYRVERVASVVRSSGRLFWPVVYLAYLAILGLLFRHLRPTTAVVACTAALALQVVDSAAAFAKFRQRLAAPEPWVSPLQSGFWEVAGSRYQRLLYVLPSNRPPGYLPLSLFAATHGMAINTGFFARVDPERESAARQRLYDRLVAYDLDPGALYVFADDPGLFERLRRRAREEDFAGVVDGFAVLAPGLGAEAGALVVGSAGVPLRRELGPLGSPDPPQSRHPFGPSSAHHFWTPVPPKGGRGRGLMARPRRGRGPPRPWRAAPWWAPGGAAAAAPSSPPPGRPPPPARG